MTKTVFSNAQCAHVWAAQTQPHGRSSNHNLYFRDSTIYSYRDSWPLATFLERTNSDGKRIVILNHDTYSTSTSGHMSDVRSALHGLGDVQVYVARETLCILLQWYSTPEARWEAFCRKAISDLVENLKARALKLSNFRSEIRSYLREDDVESTLLDTPETRIPQLNAYVDEIVQFCARFDVPDDWIAPYSLKDLCQSIRDGYAKRMSPKLVKARARALKKRAVSQLEMMVLRLQSRGYIHYGRGHNLGLNASRSPTTEGIVKTAFEIDPTKAASLIKRAQQTIAVIEIDAAFNTAHPEAHVIVWERADKKYREDYITADQWIAGVEGHLSYDHYVESTLVRRKGNVVETSRGAEVPFKAAVALYLMAQAVAHGHAQASTYSTRVGAFTLTAIDAEGNCTIGCHHLPFVEMERLALREVPHLVKARYPLPALVA